MLTGQLIHPPLIEALARTGHGGKVLVADANYPISTVHGPNASLVYLNLAPGLLRVSTVLDVLLSAVTVEAATMMHTENDAPSPAQVDYQSALGADITIANVSRWQFYDLARSSDVSLIIATGDERAYGNLLLTIGVA